MARHELASQFASVADAYERGRPEYAPAVVGALGAELGLVTGARVLDLAAGTGKLTRALLAGGLDVVAVEPLAAMRERLAAAIGAERVREGLAEAIPLADASLPLASGVGPVNVSTDWLPIGTRADTRSRNGVRIWRPGASTRVARPSFSTT